MAKPAIQSLEVADRLDAAPFARIQTAVVEAVRALVAMARRRRRRPAEHFIPRNSLEDARLECERFLYW